MLSPPTQSFNDPPLSLLQGGFTRLGSGVLSHPTTWDSATHVYRLSRKVSRSDAGTEGEGSFRRIQIRYGKSVIKPRLIDDRHDPPNWRGKVEGLLSLFSPSILLKNKEAKVQTDKIFGKRGRLVTCHGLRWSGDDDTTSATL